LHFKQQPDEPHKCVDHPKYNKDIDDIPNAERKEIEDGMKHMANYRVKATRVIAFNGPRMIGKKHEQENE
jgi:hypothetical protein